MAISASQIDAKEFSTTRISKGYDPDEVDDFLDAVAISVKTMERQIADLTGQVQKLNTELRAEWSKRDDAPTQVITTPTRILELAQETADRVVSEATQSAEEIVKAAGDESSRIRYRAEQDAQDIVGDASRDADNRRTQAEEKARLAERQLATLESSRDKLREFLQVTLSRTIEDLDTQTGS